jgi:hypothetical protein
MNLHCKNCGNILPLLDNRDDIPNGADKICSNYCPSCHEDHQGVVYEQWFENDQGEFISADPDGLNFNNVDTLRTTLFHQIGLLQQYGKQMNDLATLLGKLRVMVKNNTPGLKTYLMNSVPKEWEPKTKIRNFN